MKEIIEVLKQNKKTISTMESCTGGGLVNAITDIEGSSEVLKFSAITYSNEYKIKMGVNKEIIDKYTVYSSMTADEMSKSICNFTSSDYGVGITGQLNRFDPNNLTSENNKVYISIYDSNKEIFYNKTITVDKNSRIENKKIVISAVEDLLINIIKK